MGQVAVGHCTAFQILDSSKTFPRPIPVPPSFSWGTSFYQIITEHLAFTKEPVRTNVETWNPELPWTSNSPSALQLALYFPWNFTITRDAPGKVSGHKFLGQEFSLAYFSDTTIHLGISFIINKSRWKSTFPIISQSFLSFWLTLCRSDICQVCCFFLP